MNFAKLQATDPNTAPRMNENISMQRLCDSVILPNVDRRR